MAAIPLTTRPRTKEPTLTFYWWNDAVAHAISMNTLTHVKHRVFQTAGGWTVELAEMAVLTEACS